ncbi:PACRG protein [Phytophthora cinnamomi]|uniref:PACRG protein n=1 Tax=Phytophthora cinnamomi TaxID=4785 RepID=UPI00355996A0|nr:PACRG protein [Phytophthora cinnamomi]
MLHKHKQASVFTSGKKKHKTNFSSAYDSGSIPCRINHGSIRNALQWTKDPNSLSYDPLLITCVEGFLETEHPFVFLARATFRELMRLEDARDKTVPILAQVIVPLRGALMAKDDDTFLMALEATRMLSDLVEGEMNIYLPKLTQQIHRKLLTKQLRADVEDTLAVLESNGGKEAFAIIRSKIPTYVSIR